MGGWTGNVAAAAQRLCCHITDPRSVSCPYDGGALHLYERVGVPEARHPDGRHGRILAAAQAPPYFADLPAVLAVLLQIHGVDREGDKITGSAAGRAQGGEQVAQCPLELGDDAAVHDPAVRGVTGL